MARAWCFPRLADLGMVGKLEVVAVCLVGKGANINYKNGDVGIGERWWVVEARILQGGDEAQIVAFST